MEPHVEQLGRGGAGSPRWECGPRRGGVGTEGRYTIQCHRIPDPVGAVVLGCILQRVEGRRIHGDEELPWWDGSYKGADGRWDARERPPRGGCVGWRRVTWSGHGREGRHGIWAELVHGDRA